MTRLVDLSMPVHMDMLTFPRVPAPVLPLTRTRSPVLIRCVATEVPTTAGMPNSRETTAG